MLGYAEDEKWAGGVCAVDGRRVVVVSEAEGGDGEVGRGDGVGGGGEGAGEGGKEGGAEEGEAAGEEAGEGGEKEQRKGER